MFNNHIISKGSLTFEIEGFVNNLTILKKGETTTFCAYMSYDYIYISNDDLCALGRPQLTAYIINIIVLILLLLHIFMIIYAKCTAETDEILFQDISFSNNSAAENQELNNRTLMNRA